MPAKYKHTPRDMPASLHFAILIPNLFTTMTGSSFQFINFTHGSVPLQLTYTNVNMHSIHARLTRVRLFAQLQCGAKKPTQGGKLHAVKLC